LSQKIARQSETASTAAPASGPSTAPASCTAPTTPRGSARRSGGHRSATRASVAALQAAPEHRRPEPVGGRGEQRAERERQQAADQHRHTAAEVRQPPEQRQRGGVAEQEAADDRRGPLQLVEGHADPGQDVGQRQDDDVRVGRRDQDGQGGEDDDRQARHGGPGGRGLSRWAAR
jgi:hypothetical protein